MSIKKRFDLALQILAMNKYGMALAIALIAGPMLFINFPMFFVLLPVVVVGALAQAMSLTFKLEDEWERNKKDPQL